MKIKAAKAGALTNFEVLDILRFRGASKDPTRVIVPVAPSEFKVYDYLVETAACNQTREHINGLLGKCKKYGLAKAEVFNIINLRPSTLVEIQPIMEQSVERFKELFKDEFEDQLEEQLKELVNLVAEVLPAAPTQQKPEEEIEEENEEMADE